MRTLPYAMLFKNGNPNTEHAAKFSACLKGATEFHCYVAFASGSGVDDIWDDLVLALKDGMTARFVVGLDFYQTHPSALDSLKNLVDDYKGRVSLHISGQSSKFIFHPKVYVFKYEDETCRIVIGSANLTHGGLSSNHEVSLLYEFETEGEGTNLLRQLEVMFKTLQSSGEIVPATDKLIAEYDEKFRYYALHRRAAEIRAKAAWQQAKSKPVALTKPYMDDLLAVLELMKNDDSEDGFDYQVNLRSKTRLQAGEILDGIRMSTNLTSASFLQLYEGLVCAPIHAWHSGNLHRRRRTLAQGYSAIQNALEHLEQNITPNTTAGDAYDMLFTHLQSTDQVGPNVMTEILHTYDSTRFAIVNKNSVSGMRMACFRSFPTSPNKKTFNANKYQDFCTKAELIRLGLGLNNFTELDAVFNYAYW